MSPFKLLLFFPPLFVLARPPASSRYATILVEVITGTTTVTLRATPSKTAASASETTPIDTPFSTTVSSSAVSETGVSSVSQTTSTQMPSSTTSVLSFAVSEVGSASELQATTPAVSSNVVSSIDVISKTALPTVVAPTSAASVSSDAVVEDSVPEEGEGGPPANAFKGDVTYYDVGNGLGSCGEHSEESEMVVALSPAMMADPTSKNPNHNSKCNTYITLYHPDSNEKSQAKVVSTCPGCGEQDVDLSPALFNKIAPGGDGRVKGVAWHWS